MAGIICAIRGGPGSQANIDMGLRLARETGLPLYFLYVVNLDFMIHTETSRIHIISEEMREMGEFILLEAENQAEEHGVASEGIVRQGKIGEEILELCKELEADYVTLGRPRGEVESDFFTHPMLDELGGKIKSESNAQVVYVREVDTNED